MRTHERLRGRGGGGGRDRGQVAVEFIGMLPIILMTCVLLWQSVLFGYAYTLAGNGADRAAHEAGVSNDPAQCDEGARLGVADEDYDFDALCVRDMENNTMRATVKVQVPVLIPGLTSFSFGKVTGEASSPLEGQE
jgi:hypothetical protein